MPFSGKRKHPYKFAIYIPPQKEKIVKDFVEAFRARNESASQKILSFIERYDSLIILDRGELEHILSMIEEDKNQGLQMLKTKLSNSGRVNPQARLNSYKSTSTPKPDPYGCGRFISASGHLIRCELSNKPARETYCTQTCRYGPQGGKCPGDG